MIINRTRTRMPVCLCLGHSDQKDVNVQGKTCDIDAGQSHGCAHLRGPIATKLCEDVHDYHSCPGTHAPNYVSPRHTVELQPISIHTMHHDFPDDGFDET